MSLSRRNPRRDANEALIVEALQAAGYDVTRVSGVGAPDLLVRRLGRPGALAWGCEVKSATGRRTAAQAVSGWPIVRTPEEALFCAHILDYA